jgi:hypothetical protein
MGRETKAQAAVRISMILAEYDAKVRERNKIDSIVKGLKAQIDDIAPGTYGDWQRSAGTPREIVDQDAVKADFAGRGVPLPMKTTKAPIIVSYLGA